MTTQKNAAGGQPAAGTTRHYSELDSPSVAYPRTRAQLAGLVREWEAGE